FDGCRWAAGAELSEGSFELTSQALVFFGEFPVAVVGDFQSLQERGFGCSLPGGCWLAWGAVAECPEPVDLVFEVWLGVEPGAGDLGCVGDGLEGDWGAG